MSSSVRDTTLRLPVSGASEDARIGFRATPEAEVIGLFDEQRAPLMRYTISLGLGPSDAEDIIQEVFLSLFRHLQLGKSRANLRGWVFRVAHNLALKHRQSRQRRQPVPIAETDLAERRAAPGNNPEEAFADTQRQKLLFSVVQALPEQDRNCLRLRAESLRYREIAEVLGMSLGAVANSLLRSFEKLNRADGR
jgi:RNA polymerase sigma-70 factor (ECF subfamily)